MEKERTKVEELVLDDTVKTNKDGRPILGKLQGPCADFVLPTRNGRMYDESLWEKVFNDDIIKEYFECGGIPGELDHPTDRQETSSEKIAIMMPEPPEKDKNGQLVASFDILDTPCGRIAYTLAKYGYKLGISSRGSGDTYTDTDGNDHVDEDTYDFQGFDLVLLPAVKTARLKLIEESLNNNKSFKSALTESLSKANSDERKIMEETLNHLNIDYLDKDTTESMPSKKKLNADVVNGKGALFSDLQNALKENRKLTSKIESLQEEISVWYSKDIDKKNLIEKYKFAIKEQAKNARLLEEKVDKYEKRLQLLESKRNNSRHLLDEVENQKTKLSNLNEMLSKKSDEICNTNHMIRDLKESFRQKEEDFNSEKLLLTEQYEELRKDSELHKKQYSQQMTRDKKLIEKYKKATEDSINKYINLRATLLDVNPKEIKNRLSENFTFDDIDSICEDLQSYKVNISKLPFNIDRKKPIKMNIENVKPKGLTENFLENPDEIDEQLMSLAGLS